MSSRWNIIWAAPWGTVSWLIVEFLVFMPIFILGLVIVPVLYFICPFAQAESRATFGEQITIFAWPWAQALFGDWGDGICPLWWIQRQQGEGATVATKWTLYTYFLRNPIGNMCYLPIVSTLPSQNVRWCGTLNEVPADGIPGWFIAWQGEYVGFYYANTSWGIWLGWKLNPRDAEQNAPKDYRYAGLGTACQLMRF